MVFSLVESYFFVEGKQFTINSGSQEPVLRQFFQFLLKLALPAAHDRRQDHDPLALREAEHVLYNLINTLPGDRGAANMTVRDANRGEKQPHVVVDLSHCADCRPGTARDCLLLDGNCWR